MLPAVANLLKGTWFLTQQNVLAWGGVERPLWLVGHTTRLQGTLAGL